MKAVHSMIAALALTLVLPAAADAAQNDPEVIIYRFAGVRDDGSGTNIGVATAFHCTNFSGVLEVIRLVTRSNAGTLMANVAQGVFHLQSVTAVTHANLAYAHSSLDFNMATGALQPGTTAMAATSTNIIWTAMTIDAANPKPDGVSLRGIRFNPIPGSQE
jgi:hypothetical protein